MKTIKTAMVQLLLIINIFLFPFVVSYDQHTDDIDCSLATTYDPANGPFTFSTTNRVPLHYHGCGGADGTFIDHCCFAIGENCVILNADGIPTHDCFLPEEEDPMTTEKDISSDEEYDDNKIKPAEEQNVGVHHEQFLDCSKATTYDPDNGPGTYSMMQVSLTRHVCSQDGTIQDCCSFDSELGTCVLFLDGYPLYDCYLPEGLETKVEEEGPDSSLVALLVIVVAGIVALLCCCGFCYFVIRSRRLKGSASQNVVRKDEEIPSETGGMPIESLTLSNLEAAVAPTSKKQGEEEIPLPEPICAPAPMAEAALVSSYTSPQLKDESFFSNPPAKNPAFVGDLVATETDLKADYDCYRESRRHQSMVSSLAERVERADSSNQTHVVEDGMEAHPELAKSLTPQDLSNILGKVTFSLQKESVAKTLAIGMKGELTCEHVVAVMNECGGSLLQKVDVAKAIVPYVKDPQNKDIVMDEVGRFSTEANQISKCFPSDY